MMEASLFHREMQRLGLGLHHLRVTFGEGVDDRVDRRSPGQVKIDQRPVLVEQNADQSGREKRATATSGRGQTERPLIPS